MLSKELVLSRDSINKKVRELAGLIDKTYSPDKLVVVGILNGAFIFLADLVRAITIPHEIDFIRVSSYGKNSSSSGSIRLVKDIEIDVSGKDVLLIEDIVDTGHTLSWLQDHFYKKNANSVKTCALIDKPERREADVDVDYIGFVVEKGFLVGYGLDYAEKYRYFPEVYSITL